MAASSTAMAECLLVCVTAPVDGVARLGVALGGTGSIVAGRRDGTRACLVVETDPDSLCQLRRVLRGLSCSRAVRHSRVGALRLAGPDHLEPSATRRPRRVLVLDDDLSTQAFVAAALHPDAEILPHTAAGPALESLLHSGFDALVLDLILTGGSGLDVLRQLPARRRPARIVVLSGWRAGAATARILGVTATLPKPGRPQALRDAVLDADHDASRNPAPSPPRTIAPAAAKTHPPGDDSHTPRSAEEHQPDE